MLLHSLAELLGPPLVPLLLEHRDVVLGKVVAPVIPDVHIEAIPHARLHLLELGDPLLHLLQQHELRLTGDLHQIRELAAVLPAMVGRPLEPSPFCVCFVEGDVGEGREAGGALVPVMILSAEEAVIEDPAVLLADP